MLSAELDVALLLLLQLLPALLVASRECRCWPVLAVLLSEPLLLVCRYSLLPPLLLPMLSGELSRRCCLRGGSSEGLMIE